MELARWLQGELRHKLASIGVRVTEAQLEKLGALGTWLQTAKPPVLSRRDRQPDYIAQHIEDSTALFEICGDRAWGTVVDVGSGNGIPGLVIGILHEAATFGEASRGSTTAHSRGEYDGGTPAWRDGDERKREQRGTPRGNRRGGRGDSKSPMHGPSVYLVERSRTNALGLVRTAMRLAVSVTVVWGSVDRRVGVVSNKVWRVNMDRAQGKPVLQSEAAQPPHVAVDLAVARAVAPPPVAVQLLSPFVRAGALGAVYVGRLDPSSWSAVEGACEEAGIVGKLVEPKIFMVRGGRLLVLTTAR